MITKNRGNARIKYVHSMLVSLKMKADNRGIKLWIQSPLGQHGFSPTSIAVCLVLKAAHNLTYSEIFDHLSESSTLLKSLRLKKASSRSTLQNAASRINPEFIRWMLITATRPNMKKTLVGDSTGFSTHVNTPWINAKYGKMSRSDFVKLHIVATVGGIIVEYRTTNATRTNL